MKRCPECRRDYYDDSLHYCLDDGARLVDGPGGDEPDTAILSEPGAVRTGFPQSQTPTRPHVLSSHDGTTSNSSDHSAPVSSAEFLLTEARKNKRVVAVGLSVLIVAAGALVYWLAARGSVPGGSTPISSIAVLPLENKSGNADSEYLSDGLSESIIYRLSQIPELKVSPRSSVFRYKGQNVDAEKVGTELGVDAVMSGRLVQRGDNLTISVDLVDARSNKTLWGDQFERKMADLLATQREIASAIAERLQIKLAGSDAKGITKQYTTDNEAYQLYLKGRFHWNKRTAEGITKAIELLKQATEKDPGFALAYAALADCYVVVPVYVGRRSTEALPLAKSYARKSIEIDPTLAEPHTSLAMALWFHDWDKEAAEREYLRAIELNPKYPTGHHWYSRLLRSLKRSDEAFREIKRAEELDPLSLIFINNIAEQQIERGDLDGAEATCRRMIELDPTFWAVHQTLVWLYVKQGKLDDALAEAQKGAELSGRSNPALAQVGHVLGLLGRRADALAVAKELEERYANRSADARDLAVVHAGLGDRDAAFSWLEKAYEYRSFNLANLNMELLLEPIHDDPRWADLKRRVGIP